MMVTSTPTPRQLSTVNWSEHEGLNMPSTENADTVHWLLGPTLYHENFIVTDLGNLAVILSMDFLKSYRSND